MANLDEKYDIDNRTKAFENHKTGTLVCLAGPGTGKTFSFLKRTAALFAQKEEPETICYLTFIKEICNAFINDYIEEYGSGQYEAKKPRISTLHSFACRLIRNQGYRRKYDGDLYFVNTTDTNDDASTTLMSDLLPIVYDTFINTEAKLRGEVDKIKVAWRDQITPDILPAPIPRILPNCLELFRIYRVVDWDQTIPLAFGLLSDQDNLPEWVRKIKHYFVDEYQDFNCAEQAFITLLSTSASSIVIVGDDDQSLYRSRGGSPDGLRSMYMDKRNDQVSLVKCLRCREIIVNAANKFQATMHSNPRSMLPVKKNGQILSYSFKSTKAEIAFLSDFLSNCIKNTPNDAKSKDGTVCLFSSWQVLDFYFDQLSPHIPCLKRKPIISQKRLWLERVFNLICRPNQRLLQRLLLNNYNLIKPRHKRNLVGRIIERDISPVDALLSLLADGTFSGDLALQVQEYCNFCLDMASRDPSRIVNHIVSILKVEEVAILPHLQSLIGKIGEPELDEAISEYCDLILPDTTLPLQDSRAVLFLTMHGSKGLTKKNVIMPGLEQSWLPGNAKGNSLDEKRRLFYVALTRATDFVLMTYPIYRTPKEPLLYARQGSGAISSFVAQAGIETPYYG